VIGVDTLDVTSDARAFIRDFDLTSTMLRDAGGDSQRRFGVTGSRRRSSSTGAGG
jgi:hypothetical protein